MTKRSILSIVIFFLFLGTTAGGEENFYLIKKGDTLSKVSRESGVPVNVLLTVNNIKDPATLSVGTKITIPHVHIVQKGDTLYSIARRYGISVDELTRVNKHVKPQNLRVNQRLYLPGGVEPAKTDIIIAQSNKTDSSVPENEAKTAVFWPISGARENYNGKIRGVLISGEKGDLVYSVSSGRVIWAGPYRGFGSVVLVSAADGLVFGYLGNEELIVSVGEQIEAGSALGRLGLYFHKTDAKLLFIVYHNIKRVYLEPQQVLSSFRTQQN